MDQVTPLTNLLAQSIKVAAAYKARAEKVRPADKAELEKAAKSLADSGWITAAQVEQAVSTLSDPNQALRTLAELSTKSAEVITELKSRVGLDPRLESGSMIGKSASAAAPEVDYVGTRPATDADREWDAKMAAYRQQLDSEPVA